MIWQVSLASSLAALLPLAPAPLCPLIRTSENPPSYLGPKDAESEFGHSLMVHPSQVTLGKNIFRDWCVNTFRKATVNCNNLIMMHLLPWLHFIGPLI